MHTKNKNIPNINSNEITYMVNDMLKDSRVTSTRYGNSEVITISTLNDKPIEKCHMEILYKSTANKNGIPQILSANLFLPGNQIPQSLKTKDAIELIKSCNRYEFNQNIH